MLRAKGQTPNGTVAAHVTVATILLSAYVRTATHLESSQTIAHFVQSATQERGRLKLTWPARAVLMDLSALVRDVNRVMVRDKFQMMHKQLVKPAALVKSPSTITPSVNNAKVPRTRSSGSSVSAVATLSISNAHRVRNALLAAAPMPTARTVSPASVRRSQQRGHALVARSPMSSTLIAIRARNAVLEKSPTVTNRSV